MKNDFHLKGLDGLRAIAALSVIIGHIELMKNDNGLKNIFPFIENWGSLGVNLFFVLSGFLITTLLLKEKKERSSINLKHFYIRRILRIWPLYFLILILSALIFNYTPSWLTLLLCSTIFPNIAHALSMGWTVSPHIWSIGVEEQFYIFWPTILKKNIRFVLFVCIVLIFIYPIFPHFLQFIFNRVGFKTETLITIEKILGVLNFNAMATGALFSILYFNSNKLFIKFITFSPILNNILVLLPFLLWFGGINFGFFQTPIYSLLFGFMIVLIVNGTLTFIFEMKFLKFLGKISYGIYMYHWIFLLLFIELLEPLFNENFLLANSLFYFCVLGTTILTAYISFEYFERKILKIKARFN